MIQINIAMPDSCRECWFLNYEMYSGRTSCVIEDMTLAQYFKALDFEGRHEECPLIDVPETNVGKMEEKLKTLMDTGEFDFVNEIPKDYFWKLLFLVAFVCADYEAGEK